MPLVRIDLHQGHAAEELAAIGDVVHQAMVETIAVPADDRFQVLTEHPPGRLVFDRHFLGVERDEGIVLVQITLARGRPVEKKEALYRRIAEGLTERAGVAPGNVFVSLVDRPGGLVLRGGHRPVRRRRPGRGRLVSHGRLASPAR